MVAVAILAIAAAGAAPSMVGFIADQRVKTVAADLNSSLQRARSEAAKRNVGATVSPSTAWNAGWRVIVSGETVETHEAAPTVTVAGPTSITYSGLGRPTTSQIAFSVTATGATTARCVRVSLSGQPAVSRGACS